MSMSAPIPTSGRHSKTASILTTALSFCELRHESSFDPDYESKPLEFFAPMVREVFARRPTTRAGVVVGDVAAAARQAAVEACAADRVQWRRPSW